MRLISLNIWLGRVFNPLIEFLAKHADDVDIFCLQEVFKNGILPEGYGPGDNMDIFDDIAGLLPNFDGFLAPNYSREDSLAIFVKKDLAVDKVDWFFVSRTQNGAARQLGIPLQYIHFRCGEKKYTVCNYHGWWTSDTKADTPETLAHARIVKDFLDTIAGPKIICGDFNLSPETTSIRIVGEGMLNLVKDHGVLSTRSSLYTKTSYAFADYIFVSPEIEVSNFCAMQDEVSDHLPLILDFE